MSLGPSPFESAAKAGPPHRRCFRGALATSIMQEGMTRRASDIHIETAEKVVRIATASTGYCRTARFTIRPWPRPSSRASRYAKLDITETRLPRTAICASSTRDAPSIFASRSCPRYTAKSRAPDFGFIDQHQENDELGLSEGNLKAFLAAIKRPTASYW